MVENHELCQSLRIAYRPFLNQRWHDGLGNRVSCLRNTSGPKAIVQGASSRPQHVLSQAKSRMNQPPMLFVRGVEAQAQSQQCYPIEICEFCFGICLRVV